MPALLPDLKLGPLSRQQLEKHRDEVLAIARRLLPQRDAA